MPKPHFTIRNKFQKRSELYQDILTNELLTDVCYRITGRRKYTVSFDNTSYNKGRLATLEYNESISYISFSESEIRSRNSFFQSFPSALIKYYQEINPNKDIYFYFLEPDSNIETSYFIFMYRLMKTAGTIFLNESDYLQHQVDPFSSVSDIITQRDINRRRNSGNLSSYVTFDENNKLQIFGKTFGANKYETTLLCLAIHKVAHLNIELYEIREGNLKQLPQDARDVIISLGIEVVNSDFTLEREEFVTNNSLRSPTYLYNQLNKLGEKRCSLCDCEIPQIIQGAHVWPVSNIKNLTNIDLNAKIQFAIDGENGLWLCCNHHKLFDINLLYIHSDGRLKYKSNVQETYADYLQDYTTKTRVPEEILTLKFNDYLSKRNENLDESLYSFLE